MNAIRQIADGLRLQDPTPLSWDKVREHAEPVGDLLVQFGPEDDADRQYAFLVKWWDAEDVLFPLLPDYLP